MSKPDTAKPRQATEHQRIRAAESRIEFTVAGLMTFLIAGTFIYVHLLFKPVVPPENLMLWTGFMGFVIVLLIALPLTVLIRRPDDLELATIWARAGNVVTALFDLAVASAVWLFFPYASEQLQLLMVVFFCATISAQVITTAEAIGNITFAVVAVLGSTAAFFLQGNSSYAVALAVFLTAYGLLMIGVALTLKYAVRSAIKSRLKAEEASADLALALEQAQKARDDRTTFIAAASHDLRQPLQAAMLFFQQLQMNPKAQLRARAETGVQQAFQEANALLDRMLEHLRLESGTMPTAICAVDLAPLIATMAAEHEVIVRNAGMRLRAYGGFHRARTDPHLLSRILRNLLHNACTHAQGERLLIFTRQIGNRVRIYVIDDGIGFGDHAETCFEPYVQGAVARGKAQGMGLGLAVAREMARLVGGSLGLDTRWTAGAAVYIELPMLPNIKTPAIPRPPKSAGREALANLRIVMIDDDEGARTALADLLGLLAGNVRAVASLAELAALDDAPADLIVSDWHLADGHLGDEAVSLAQRKWPGIAAVFITGDGSPETLHAMSASQIPVLWKPTNIDELGIIAAKTIQMQREDAS
ncbi:ATP-binding protein [Novosphingobium sp. SL115]|uniref:ATP-binding response regulator n=1 Tax=Novosphingobium sp. SL115 TaxID=2995150 RepID=UPI0022753A37|nr:ATP-binding protein [Novosphingobium sp. SL115]MCY1669681.1 ATP-binding protein [Novosphingobium sp. SL115]